MNIAVAWGCVLLQAPLTQDWAPHHNPTGGDPLIIFATDRTGVQIVSGCGRSGTLLDRHGEKVKQYDGSPWWPAEALNPLHGNYALAAGWPVPAFRAIYTQTWDPPMGKGDIDITEQLRGGFLVRAVHGPPNDLSHFQPQDIVLPFGPMWLGMLLNTLFYGFLLWCCIISINALRRWSRRKRGLCPACRYPIGESTVCTECGCALPA